MKLRLNSVLPAYEKHSVLIKRNAGNLVIGKYFLLLEDLWVTKKFIDLSFLFFK